MNVGSGSDRLLVVVALAIVDGSASVFASVSLPPVWVLCLWPWRRPWQGRWTPRDSTAPRMIRRREEQEQVQVQP